MWRVVEERGGRYGWIRDGWVGGWRGVGVADERRRSVRGRDSRGGCYTSSMATGFGGNKTMIKGLG